MLNVITTLALHFLLTASTQAYSDNSFYLPSKNKGAQFRSPGAEAERSTRRVFIERPIRFGGRADIPPLVGKAMEYEAMLAEHNDLTDDRERRAFSKATGNHMRFGRADANFLRFGRSRSKSGSNSNNGRNDYNRLTRANNLFMRFGRGRNDFLRFGRSEEYSRKKREEFADFEEEKRGNSNFMRYGKRRYEDDDQSLDEDMDESNRHLEEKLRDALVAKLFSQVGCDMDSDDCGRMD